MAKLFTHHDPVHIHAFLGFLALCHYTFRLGKVVLTGYSFHPQEDIMIQTCCILLHGVLSISSLLLPLPSKRNVHLPVIWTEMRLHSITFALRHVIASLLCLSGNISARDAIENPFAFTSIRICLITTVMIAADMITHNYGDNLLRTTNSLRPSPYINSHQQLQTKMFYAVAQFFATSLCLSGDVDLSFWSLLPIQGAALFQTLVRKGKLTTTQFHVLYSITLLIPSFMAMVKGLHRTFDYNTVSIWIFVAIAAQALRLDFKWPKYVLWTMLVASVTMIINASHHWKLGIFEIPNLANASYGIGGLFLIVDRVYRSRGIYQNFFNTTRSSGDTHYTDAKHDCINSNNAFSINASKCWTTPKSHSGQEEDEKKVDDPNPQKLKFEDDPTTQSKAQ